MENKYINCIIEKGYNTDYINSLLLAMFYKSSNIETILEYTKKTNTSFIYMQELIKSKFIEPLRCVYSISDNVINEIRNYAVICGWYNYMTDDMDDTVNNIDFIEQKNILNFYKFIIHLCDKNIFNNIIYNVKNNTNIKEIINLNNISYTPKFVCIQLNREQNDNYDVDIMKQILINKSKLHIHSIICKDKNNKFYTVFLSYDKKWIYYDENNIPSLKYIDIDDYKENIMLEVIMIFYVL